MHDLAKASANMFVYWIMRTEKHEFIETRRHHIDAAGTQTKKYVDVDPRSRQKPTIFNWNKTIMWMMSQSPSHTLTPVLLFCSYSCTVYRAISVCWPKSMQIRTEPTIKQSTIAHILSPWKTHKFLARSYVAIAPIALGNWIRLRFIDFYPLLVYALHQSNVLRTHMRYPYAHIPKQTQWMLTYN